MCKISIITVCYNVEHEIEQTLISVLNQTYENFEYIIIDGKSQDRTPDIIQNYQSSFNKKGIDVVFVSEKDSGIYNAMNKGILKANGEWLLFLNAGDYLCDYDVIKKISTIKEQSKYDVIYGDVIYKWSDMYYYHKCDSSPDNLVNYSVVPHQCAFIKKSSMVCYMYDEKYKICADYDFFLKLYLHGHSFYYTNFPISVFVIGGISTDSSKIIQRELERTEIFYSNNIIDRNKYNKLIFKTYIKTLFPKCFLNRRMEKFYREDGWTKDFPNY